MRGSLPMGSSRFSSLSALSDLYKRPSPELLAESYLLLKEISAQVVNEILPGSDLEFPHDFALDLAYRIAKKKFNPPSNIWSLRKYIKKTFFTRRIGNKIEDSSRIIPFENEMASLLCDNIDLDAAIDSRTAACQVLLSLMEFYSLDQIKKNLPLAVISYRDKISISVMSEDFKRFYLTFESILRGVRERNEFGEFFLGTTRIDDGVKSIIAAVALKRLFLEIVDSDLVYSLDFGSLFRLAQVAGGRKISVPKIQELNDVMARSRSFADFLFDECSSISTTKSGVRSYMEVKDTPHSTLRGESISDFLSRGLREIPVNKYIDVVVEALVGLLEDMIRVLKECGSSLGDDRYLMVVEEVSRLIYLLNKSMGKTVHASVSSMMDAVAKDKESVSVKTFRGGA